MLQPQQSDHLDRVVQLVGQHSVMCIPSHSKVTVEGPRALLHKKLLSAVDTVILKVVLKNQEKRQHETNERVSSTKFGQVYDMFLVETQTEEEMNTNLVDIAIDVRH